MLLVEDDQEVVGAHARDAEQPRLLVIHVTGAEAALGALANARAIDVVLSDIMMPGGVSGLELAREIRRGYPNLPVILTTGYAEAAAGMKDGNSSCC